MKSILFDNVHLYNDLNLVVAPFEIAPAKAKTNFVDVAGADGSLDLTEAFGEVKFADREGSLIFYVLPGDDWERKKQLIGSINGAQSKLTLEKDPEYYYLGRFTVNEYKSDRMLRQITVNYRLKPYKYKHNVTTVTLGKGTHSIICDRMPVVPVITATKSAKITFGGSTYSINAGTHKLLDIRFTEGANELTIDTTGSVTFEYQEGAL